MEDTVSDFLQSVDLIMEGRLSPEEEKKEFANLNVCTAKAEEAIEIAGKLITKKVAIGFAIWLTNEAWQPYDCDERWINQEQGDVVRLVSELYDMYIKSN